MKPNLTQLAIIKAFALALSHSIGKYIDTTEEDTLEGIVKANALASENEMPCYAITSYSIQICTRIFKYESPNKRAAFEVGNTFNEFRLQSTSVPNVKLVVNDENGLVTVLGLTPQNLPYQLERFAGLIQNVVNAVIEVYPEARRVNEPLLKALRSYLVSEDYYKDMVARLAESLREKETALLQVAEKSAYFLEPLAPLVEDDEPVITQEDIDAIDNAFHQDPMLREEEEV